MVLSKKNKMKFKLFEEVVCIISSVNIFSSDSNIKKPLSLLWTSEIF